MHELIDGLIKSYGFNTFITTSLSVFTFIGFVIGGICSNWWKNKNYKLNGIVVFHLNLKL